MANGAYTRSNVQAPTGSGTGSKVRVYTDFSSDIDLLAAGNSVPPRELHVADYGSGSLVVEDLTGTESTMTISANHTPVPVSFSRIDSTTDVGEVWAIW